MSPSWRNRLAATIPQPRAAANGNATRSPGIRIAGHCRRRDEVGVALFPDRLIVARVGGWRRRLVSKAAIALRPAAPDAPRWRPALEALAGGIGAGALAGANVTLVLSSHFVHYTLVPWSNLIRGEDQHLTFARQRFTRVHGSAAESWSLRLSAAAPRQARLACGLPAGLLHDLEEVMVPIGRHYRSLQPHLMASFNRWRARLGARPGWFMVVEPGLACLALLRDEQWRSVRQFRIDEAWPQQLARLLEREQCLAECDARCEQVSVFAPDMPADTALHAGPWRVDALRPALLPGMAPGIDEPFSIAVGV